MGLNLYFPEGTPANVERILDPDVIFQKVSEGLKAVESDWKRLAPQANAITHGKRPWWKRLFGQTNVDPEWLHYYLYRKPSEWPVTPKEKRLLLVLRRLRQMARTHGDMRLTPEMRANPPSKEAIKKAFGYMAADAEPLLRQMEKSFRSQFERVGAQIEPLCDQVYGEPCEPGEGKEIALADVNRLLKMGNTGLSDPMEFTLREWLIWFTGQTGG